MGKLAESQGQYVVNAKGERIAVLLPLGEYRRLIEDLHDLAKVAERRTEEPLSLEEMRLRLKEHGPL